MNLPARCPVVAACRRLVFGILFSLYARGDPTHAEGLPLLTTTREVHALTAEQARRGYPIRLRGTITFYDQKHFNTCFIHDETGGLSVLTPGEQFVLSIGDRVEMTGVSDPGNFAPMIRALGVMVLSHGEPPKARPSTYESMTTGLEDSQWIELAGIVRSVWEDKAASRLVVEIATGGGRLIARIRDYDPERRYDGLVDAAVRVRGVCSQLFNLKRQMRSVRLLVPSISDVTVDEAAPSDPFSAPVHPIIRLFQFTPEGNYGRRVRVQGVVTYVDPGRAIYIRDDTQSMLIQPATAEPVDPGDHIDVVGFPSTGEWTPFLQDATFRKTGRTLPLSFAKVTAEEAISGAHDGALVLLDATVLDHVHRSDEEILVLQAGAQIFEAILNQGNSGKLAQLGGFHKGSSVRLTGICIVEVGNRRAPHAFRLMLRSARDVTLLERPPWWTLTRLLWILGGVSFATVAGWSWAVALGNRVRRQTAIISDKIQREAAFEERTRLAREFHDTLEQEFTGIRLQLDAVKTKLHEAPQEADEYLDVARRLIRHSHAEARRAVWDLRSDILERHDLASALTQTIAQAATHGTPVHVSVNGKARRILGWIENHLLRIGQEAVTNALKHANAGAIRVQLEFGTGSLRLRVSDDGRGFEIRDHPFEDGHFGLLGMKERAEKIGGHLEVISSAANGTTITVELPLESVEPSLANLA